MRCVLFCCAERAALSVICPDADLPACCSFRHGLRRATFLREEGFGFPHNPNLSLPLGEMSHSDREGWLPLWGSWIAALRQDWGSSWLACFSDLLWYELGRTLPSQSFASQIPALPRWEPRSHYEPHAKRIRVIWCRLSRVLLLPSQLTPRHLPQRGRLFVRCLTIWSMCVQTSEKFLSICWFENRITNRWYDSKTAVLSLSYAIPCASLCCAPSSSMTSLAAWQ